MQCNTPLMAACGGGHAAIVRLLLKAGADVEKETGREDYYDDYVVRGYEHTATSVRSC
jgi:ankyrin repeat protein